MAFVLVMLTLAISAGLAHGETATPVRPVALTITFWPDEQEPQTFERWTLRCNPLGGTLPRRKAACVRLAAMAPAAFAPVPRDAICTQIYGGPQKAVVKGTFGDRRIWASLRRRNGCEIDRWQRFSPWLLPSGGATR